MKLQSLHDLFAEEMQDLYDAENQILKALPKMQKAADSSDLKEAFAQHLKQTQDQVGRLETIADQLSLDLNGKKCVGMEGIIKEGEEVLKENMETNVRDAALIAAAQRVEHYEIAAYGCVRTFARILGYKDAVTLLQETLDEEGNADHILSAIAQKHINKEAKQSQYSIH